VAWEGEVGLFFKEGRWDFLNFSSIILLVVWDGVFRESGWVFFFLFFFSFVIW
jgi:hypothetical protein